MGRTNNNNDAFKEKVRAAIDYTAYFREIIEGFKPVSGGGEQYLGMCPFHGDTKLSLSINVKLGVFNCKGCGERGDIFTFHAAFYKLGGFNEALNDLAQKYGVERPGKPVETKRKATGLLPSAELLKKLQDNLLSDSASLEKLEKTRLLTRKTIEKYGLGLDHKRKRLTIPIYDEHNKLVNVRLYSSTDQEKMISWGKGTGAAVIYGLNDLKEYPLSEPLIICEGEFDRLLLVQAGFQAITHTNGANSFQKEWTQLFNGRHVVLVYDADQGGRDGAEKTKGLLSRSVSSLRIIDLQEAGLVEGTKESNDVTDMARALPDWPDRLRKVIDEAQCIDLASMPVSEQSEGLDYAKIFIKHIEQSGCICRLGRNGDLMTPISNFTLKPIRRIMVEDQEVLEAELTVADDQESSCKLTLWPSHWSNKTAFKRQIGVLGAGFVGSESDLQELKVMLSKKECPTLEGKTKLGIHEHNGEWVFAATDKSLSANGEITDLIHWEKEGTDAEYRVGKIKPTVKDDFVAAAESLLRYNSWDITAPVLAWMVSLPFKERLKNAVPQLFSQFPILLLWGERGAGKTKTAETVIAPFFSRSTGLAKIDEMTKYTLMLDVSSTNLLPRIYDEYKPSKMKDWQRKEVSNVLRSTYNSAVGKRGNVGSEGLEQKEYSYTAPVCLIGEQVFTESALKERIIEVEYSKKKREHCEFPIEKFVLMNLAGVGFSYIRWSLGVMDAEIEKVWKEEFVNVSSLFKDRLQQNVATVRMGLRFWFRFLREEGVNVDKGLMEAAFDSIDQSQVENLLEGGERQKTDVDMIIESMAAMASSPNKEIRSQYEYVVGADTICFRLQTLYPAWRKWAKDHQFDGEILDENSFKKQLKMQSYYIDNRSLTTFKVSGGEIKRLKAWKLDLLKMENLGLDVSGFGLDDEENINDDLFNQGNYETPF